MTNLFWKNRSDNQPITTITPVTTVNDPDRMRNPLLGSPFISDDVTDHIFNGSFLVIGDPATTNYLANGLVIFDTTLSFDASCQFRLELFDDLAASQYDSGFLDAVDHQCGNSILFPIASDPGETQTYNVSIKDPGNPAGVFSINRMFVGETLKLAVPFSASFPIRSTVRHGRRLVGTEGGVFAGAPLFNLAGNGEANRVTVVVAAIERRARVDPSINTEWFARTLGV